MTIWEAEKERMAVEAKEAYSADVVVVGAGNAGLCAALSAQQSGARVVVLESAPPIERGGNSQFSGGIFRFVHGGFTDLLPLLTPESKRWADLVDVPPYSADDFAGDLATTSASQSDPELTGLVVAHSRPTIEWMRSQGVRFELTADKLVDPEKAVAGHRYTLAPGGAVRAEHEGVGLMKALFNAIEASGIAIEYNAPAHRLLADGDRVFGVRVRRESGFEDYLGTVILASGGFEASPELRQQYLGPGWDLVKVRGSRYNTGAMLTEALASGAQAYGHWGGCHASPLDAAAPSVGDLTLTDKLSRYSYPYGILVNRRGERFIDEGENQVWLTYAKTGAAIRSQPEGLAFQIFDQQTIHLLEPRYSTGRATVAESIADLASVLGIEPAALERTIDAFNQATWAGRFDPFSKDGLSTDPSLLIPKSNWALPLNKPPFVAYPVTCGITFTYGGIRVDERAQVRNREGRPLHGLYATGEITGGFFYHNYPGGAGLMRGSVFGRLAGQAAAEMGSRRPGRPQPVSD